MSIKKIATIAFLVSTNSALATDSPVNGLVQPKCSVYTEIQGVYGHPLPNKLSTAAADGGVAASIRYDIAQADFYKAQITHPLTFSSAPAKVISPINVTTFDMTLAGSTWFTVQSTAVYGYNKSLPAGSYTAIIQADCIAK